MPDRELDRLTRAGHTDAARRYRQAAAALAAHERAAAHRPGPVQPAAPPRE